MGIPATIMPPQGRQVMVVSMVLQIVEHFDLVAY